MDVLLIQFSAAGAADETGAFKHDLAVASAVLGEQGARVAWLHLTDVEPETIRKAVLRRRPRAVIIDATPRAANGVRRTIGHIRKTYALPTILVGPYPSCLPRQAISIPGCEAVIVGEYEHVLAELLGHLLEQDPGECPPGAWVNTEDGLTRGPAPIPAEIDRLPAPDDRLADVRDDGKTLTIKACRGCSQWCAYCLNDWYLDIYRDRGPAVRRRRPDALLDQWNQALARRPGLIGARFPDHAFAADVEWLGQFADLWRRAAGPRFHCHVRANELAPEAAGLLASAGCESVTLPVISGSSFIRDEVLNMRTSGDQIAEAVAWLREANLGVEARVFVGAPYETEISVEQTRELLLRLRPDAVDVRVYHPTAGTRAAELCREQGWISGRAEDPAERDLSLLDMPSLAPGRIAELARQLRTIGRSNGRLGLRRMLGRWRRRGR